MTREIIVLCPLCKRPMTTVEEAEDEEVVLVLADCGNENCPVHVFAERSSRAMSGDGAFGEITDGLVH